MKAPLEIDWKVLGPKLWDALPKTTPYDWPGINSNQEKSLRALFPGFESISPDLSALDHNRALRRQIAPVLIAARGADVGPLARWIIVSWGGIQGGSQVEGRDPIPRWAQALAGFTPQAISAFHNQQGVERISSWSKITAFARPEEHAIYDTRIAVALNIGLASLGVQKRFHLPTSRNKLVRRAAEFFGHVGDLGYTEYLAFLSGLKEARGLPFLDAETTIFANSPDLCRKFMSELDGAASEAALRACAQ